MKKNILYIHTHDSGRYLEPYGFSVKTPRIMKLAREGTLFRNMYCAAPTCSPSRAGLLTGMAPHSAGILGLANRGFRMKDYGWHLCSFLKENGYHTCLFGVQHEAPDSAEIGYEYRYEYECGLFEFTRRDRMASARAAEYLRNYKGDRPFFMSVGFMNTHRPFPEDFRESINPDYVTPPYPVADTKENREDTAGYLRAAEIADTCVGTVLDALKDAGMEESTIVIFTTDHGIAFPFMKCNGFDTGIGVAMIMKYSGNPAAGKACGALLSQIDLFPTLCEMNGLEKPDYVQGKSFFKLFRNPEDKINDEIFAEVTYHVVYEPMRCIRTERYKLIRYYDICGRHLPANIDDSACKSFLVEHGLLRKSRPRELLFDLYLDPVERENVAENPDYAEIYENLRMRLERWMERTGDPLAAAGIQVPQPEGTVVESKESISSGR